MKPTRRKWPDDYMADDIDQTAGMRCPACNCPRSTVYYTRQNQPQVTTRRRICQHCGRKFTTIERKI